MPGTAAYDIGGIPVVDAYFNLKVKRMFFFIEGQHLNTLIDNNKVYMETILSNLDSILDGEALLNECARIISHGAEVNNLF